MTDASMDDGRPVVDREPVKPGEYKRIYADLTPQDMPEVPLSTILAGEQSEIVFISDIHGKLPIGNILNYGDAQKLRKLGFTHYLFEGSSGLQPLLDGLNERTGIVDLHGMRGLNPDGIQPHYVSAIYNMAHAGLEVRAIDHPAIFDISTPVPGEEREAFIFEQIKTVRKKGGKPIILYGSLHAQPDALGGTVSTVTQRLLNNGENVLSVNFPPRTLPRHTPRRIIRM